MSVENLVNFGALGIVLGWFMIRLEPRMQSLERAIDRMGRAVLILTLSQTESEETSKAANDLLTEIDRGKPPNVS